MPLHGKFSITVTKIPFTTGAAGNGGPNKEGHSMDTPDAVKWYSPRAIAELLDINYDTALTLVHNLPHIDAGKGHKRSCPRVRPEVFHAWLAQQDGYNPGVRCLRVVRGGKRP